MRARPTSPNGLQTRLAELELSVLFPCDLGDGIEVIHDVEDAVEIEMDCSIDVGHDGGTEGSADGSADDADVDIEPGHTDLDLRVALGLHIEAEIQQAENQPAAELLAAFDDHTSPYVRDVDSTHQFVRESDSTHQFVRESAPYERIEIQVDPKAFLRATIEDAKAAARRPRN
jgi:hypothetical protein